MHMYFRVPHKVSVISSARCTEISAKIYDLGKDVQNYNRAIFYLSNFWNIDSETIIHFIIEVRQDNIIYTAIQQLLKIYRNFVVNGMPPKLTKLCCLTCTKEHDIML